MAALVESSHLPLIGWLTSGSSFQTMGRQHWDVGDAFSVEIAEGQVAIGQVIGREPSLPRSATVSLFDQRHPSYESAAERVFLDPKAVYAILFVTTQQLDNGSWRVLKHCQVAVDTNLNPFEHLRDKGFVGARIVGANIVSELARAFFGLSAWDDWSDPSYLDTLLISPEVKPTARLLFKR
jgi:hypothetical protein